LEGDGDSETIAARRGNVSLLKRVSRMEVHIWKIGENGGTKEKRKREAGNQSPKANIG